MKCFFADALLAANDLPKRLTDGPLEAVAGIEHVLSQRLVSGFVPGSVPARRPDEQGRGKDGWPGDMSGRPLILFCEIAEVSSSGSRIVSSDSEVMFYFSHAYTLSAILEYDLLEDESVKAWQRTAETVVLSSVERHP